MKKQLKLTFAVVPLIVACIILSACPTSNAVQDASNAVNKYANTLSAFQDAEITLHNSAKISDSTHHSILEAELVAAKAGHELDAAIAVASHGNDPSQYIDVATQAFTAMEATVNGDSTSKQELSLTVEAAGAALKNAITLINSLRSSKPSPSVPKADNQLNYSWLWALGLLPLMGMAATFDGAQVIQLLQILLQLEPVAFDLITKFATSLKGKTTEEILAMNESLFSKVEQTAQDELNKSPSGSD